MNGDAAKPTTSCAALASVLASVLANRERIMADQATGTAASGGNGAAEHQLIVNAQYVKDLSFENPRAPHSLLQQKEPPEVQLGVDVRAQPLGQDVFEVVLSVTANAKSANEAVFVVELAYAAVVTVRNTPQELLPVMLLVETPRLLFPFARSVIASATREGGFPPLLLHPVDFAELLRRQQAAQTAQPVATA
jgi:preprotein translocase subunit SecB